MNCIADPIQRPGRGILFLLGTMVLGALVCAGSAAAQENTKLGTGALPSPSSPVLFDSAFGSNALNSPTSGPSNTAIGALALSRDTTGQGNTATGVAAMESNTTGSENTADGSSALAGDSGSFNTAIGASAMTQNTTGNDNTAVGYFAMALNSSGNLNTASGFRALVSNKAGSGNTASGADALQSNSTGLYNTAAGYRALVANTTGGSGTAAGVNALWKNTTGTQNTAVGTNTMFSNTTGSNNTALGNEAGFSLTTGSNNVDIGNLGVAAESGTIRIGTQGTQSKAFIAGISSTMVTGDAVLVSSTGQLGMMVSSARYKREIHDMDAASSNLMKLRPVTFRYKDDPQGIKQYGLVAEEVARVYPELVSYDHGKVESVHYLTLTAMLLNELQKQALELQKQATELRNQRQENAQQVEQIKRLSAQMAAVRTVFEEHLSKLERMIQAKNGDGKLAASRLRLSECTAPPALSELGTLRAGN